MAEENNNDSVQVLQERVQAMSELVSRAEMASKLGQSYGGERNIYDALGYPKQLYFDNYLAKWTRQDIAKAVINRPIASTWSGSVSIDEGESDKERTPLQEDWERLFKRLKLRFKFARLDRLASLGQYAVLLLGLDDVANEDGFKNPVDESQNLNLLYVKPYSEKTATISEWDRDPNSERYGLPKIYKIKTYNDLSKTSIDLEVHHSRIIHVVTECLENEVYGEPRLRAIYNRLQDLEKITGGSAEMFWRGARPGYNANMNSEHQLGSQTEEDLKKQLREYENKLRRFLVTEGMEINSLDQQVADPSNHVDIQLKMISAETGYPVKILIGSEQGELQSTEDKSQWNDIIQARRYEYAEPLILEPFMEAGIRYGFLREPQDELDYHYLWQDLYAPSQKEQANIGQTLASALGTYAKQPAAWDFVPPHLFIEMMGVPRSMQRKIQSYLTEEMEQERREMEEEEAEIEENPEATPPAPGVPDDVSQG